MQIFLFFLLGYLAWKLLHRRREENWDEEGENTGWLFRPQVSGVPDGPEPFGYKTAWLAVRAGSPEEAAALLGGQEPEAANWSTGLAASEEPGWVFVTPPVSGYVLAVGVGDLTEDREALGRLAGRFPELQYYVSQRVVGLYGWVRYRRGVLERAYVYLGEEGRVLWDEGALTREEEALGLEHLPRGQRTDWRRAVLPDEGDVLRVSASWGVDTTFQSSRPGRSVGLLCRLLRPGQQGPEQ